MSINDHDESIQDEQPKVEVGSGSEKPVSAPASEEMVYKSIAKTLGLDSFSEMEKYKDDIQRIAEYAKAQGTEDTMDFDWVVKQLSQTVGSPALGEKLITSVSRYVYLLNEKSRVEKEIDEMGAVK